jgi:hypothetical protein
MNLTRFTAGAICISSVFTLCLFFFFSPGFDSTVLWLDGEEIPIPVLDTSKEDRAAFVKEIRSKIAIGILTTGKLHHRLAHAMESWWNFEEFKDMVTVFSDVGSPHRLPDGREIPNIVETDCENTYNVGLWCKNTYMWKYWRSKPEFKDVQWFVRVMDDSYVHMENLLDLVKQYNSSERTVIGDKHCAHTGHPYPSGGPGVLFSRGLLEDFDEATWKRPVEEAISPSRVFDDVIWGDYLNLRNVPIINHMGIEQTPNRLEAPQWHYWMRFENGLGNLWNLPYRPVLLHQHGMPMNMTYLHIKLHNITYSPLADQLVEIPECKCPGFRHQKCVWNQDLTDRGRCQWGFERLECIGPGPWDLLDRPQPVP